MLTYQSKPQLIEAVHVGQPISPRGEHLLINQLGQIAPDKWRIDPATGSITLLAGKDGAQEWVPVPWGHWLVRQPGDPSDIWPVEAAYFAAKYTLATACPVTDR